MAFNNEDPTRRPTICLICRVQATNNGNNWHCIFSTFMGVNRLDKLIAYFFEFELSEESNWPAFICSNCYSVVIKMFRMKIKFIDSIRLYSFIDSRMLLHNFEIQFGHLDNRVNDFFNNPRFDQLRLMIDAIIDSHPEEHFNAHNDDRDHDEEEDEDDNVNSDDDGVDNDDGGVNNDDDGVDNDDDGVNNDNDGVNNEYNDVNNDDGGVNNDDDGVDNDDDGVNNDNDGVNNEYNDVNNDDSGVNNDDGGVNNDDGGVNNDDGGVNNDDNVINNNNDDDDDDDCQIISSPLESPIYISDTSDGNLAIGPEVQMHDNHLAVNNRFQFGEHNELFRATNNNNVNETDDSENENSSEPFKKILTSEMKFFTCFFCNEIFHALTTFKKHYSSHYNMNGLVMCWTCFKPQQFKTLRSHQASDECTFIPEFLDCKVCSEKCSNIEALSIHKYIKHNATFVHKYPVIFCPFCHIDLLMKNLKNHLNTCSSERVLLESKNQTSGINDFKCRSCNKLFLSKVGYTNHMKTHRLYKNKRTRI